MPLAQKVKADLIATAEPLTPAIEDTFLAENGTSPVKVGWRSGLSLGKGRLLKPVALFVHAWLRRGTQTWSDCQVCRIKVRCDRTLVLGRYLI